MKNLEICVIYKGEKLELGCCDKDHISLIILFLSVNASVNAETGGRGDLVNEDYNIYVNIPWSRDRIVVRHDKELLALFDMFEERQLKRIEFEIEMNSPPPFEHEGDVESTARVVGVEELDISDDSLSAVGAVEAAGEAVEGDEGAVECGEAGEGCEAAVEDVLEGYKSGDNDYFDSDSENDTPEARISRIMNQNPFARREDTRIEFAVGQTHESVYTLRDLLREYAIQEGINFQRVKNDKDRLTYKCAGEGCPWRIHASCMVDRETMMIRTLNGNHECIRTYKSNEAGVRWIANKFEALVKSNPDMKVGVISDILRERYRVNVNVKRLYKAKKQALDSLGADHSTCFSKLRKYAYMIRKSNPGSIAYLHLKEPYPIFQRFMMCFDAQRAGFLDGCRPFIGLDGCHLKGPYKGVLLSAVALDANSGIFPLAVCICEIETFPSWTWFLDHLARYLKYPEDMPLTFMTDRQKGVLKALELNFPTALSRHCARHIYANFRLKHSGAKLKRLFWAASRACIVYEFKAALDEIEKVDDKAKTWLAKLDPASWSRHAFDTSVKCDHVTNNMTESFNSMLGDHRAKTYLGLLESIRRLVMKCFQQRREQAAKWNNDLPPVVHSRIIKASTRSRILTMLSAGNGEYELLGERRAYVAKLKEFSCECGEWQLSGVPCSHAVAGIGHYYQSMHLQNRMVDFVHPHLTKASFLRTYDKMIHPVPDSCAWPDIQTDEVLPPEVKKLPGRPRKARKREADEKPFQSRRGTVACKICGGLGHNKKTCKNSSKKQKKNAESSSQPTNLPQS